MEEEENFDEEDYCDYDVCEICEHPEIKAMGLCTTECEAYMDAVEASD